MIFVSIFFFALNGDESLGTGPHDANSQIVD
jgi:hypothetical protein